MTRESFSLLVVKISIFVIFFVFLQELAIASHFRYSHLSWKSRRDIGQYAAEITLFSAFRRSGYSGSGKDSRPVIGDIIKEDIGTTSLSFGDGTQLGSPLDFLVIAYDPTADWIYCKALADRNHLALEIIHNYSSPGPWTAEISDCCRLNDLVNAAGQNYRIQTTINFTKEYSSPVSTLPAIINCQIGKACNFSVPAGDSDTENDILFWRLATGAENGNISQPPGLTINSSTGNVAWNTAGRTQGLYACQVVIEAHNKDNNDFKSSVAVDFLINLSNTPLSSAPPIFDKPNTTNCGKTYEVAVGKALDNIIIQASDPDIGNTVTLNAIGLPLGAKMTPSLPTTGNPVSSTLSWAPTLSQIGTHVIVFTATDNTGLQAQCSVVVVVKGDSDGDGLPDDWEKNGYTYNGKFVDLKAMGANPNHKDIFVEIDYMKEHKPDQVAVLNKIIDSFAKAPIPNPDLKDGITLHLVLSDELEHKDQLGSNQDDYYHWDEFDNLKSQHFDPALALSYHYCIFAHNGPKEKGLLGGYNGGISRGIPTSDFLVTLGESGASFCVPLLGCGVHGGGTNAEQAGTFMHELGHNLGLSHSGPIKLVCPDPIKDPNCTKGNPFEYKPNYLSVMNYLFARTGLFKNGKYGLFDYSRFDEHDIPDLDETKLNEEDGLRGLPEVNDFGTAWKKGARSTSKANDPIDWNNSKIPFLSDGIDKGTVSSDINNDNKYSTLKSYNDWANLEFNGGLIGAGIPIPLASETIVDELDIETAKAIAPFAPINLISSLKNGKVELGWLPVGGSEEYQYKIYRNRGNGAFTFLTQVAASSFSDPDVVVGETYSYYLTTINILGAESLPSLITTTSVLASGYESDVSPRPTGKQTGKVTMADWVQLGRFYVGSDTVTLGSEFQRADCYPKETKGDGKITIGDWVQAGRFAAGLDPVVPAGGPTTLSLLAPSPTFAKLSFATEAQTRTVRIGNANFLRGQIGTLPIELEAQGNENALAFSLNFDPKQLNFVDAQVSEGAGGAALQINSAQAASGRLGLALILPPGQQLAAGTRTLLNLRFSPSSGEGNVMTNLSFGDQVFAREIVDAFAAPVGQINYLGSSITISGRAAANVSAASYVGADLAADSIASAFGTKLATMTAQAASLPLPNTLGGTTVKIKDSQGVERIASLFFVSPNQINYQIPTGTAEGIATVMIMNGAGEETLGLLNIGKVAPGIFSADSSGKGWAAADVVYVKSDQSQVQDRAARFDVGQNKFVPVPIDLREDVAVLVLYGTGIRHRSDLANVKVTIGGVEAVIDYADKQGQFFGLDQINVRLPKSLLGRGEVPVAVSVEGKAANSVNIYLK